MKHEKRISNTCIALIKRKNGKLLMAGDRRCSWGYSFAQSMEFPKVNKKDNVLVGATGDGDMCSLFVEDGGFRFPERKIKCINSYMYHTVKPAVRRFLIGQGYGDKKTDQLHLIPDCYVEVVIGIEGQCWSLTVQNPLETAEHLVGDISLGRIPSIPYVTGCGRSSCYSILKYEQKRNKYLTKEILKDAMLITAEISPGCDGLIDFVESDE